MSFDYAQLKITNFHLLMKRFPIVPPSYIHALLVRLDHDAFLVMALIETEFKNNLAEYREKKRLEDPLQAQNQHSERILGLDSQIEDTAENVNKETITANEIPVSTEEKLPENLTERKIVPSEVKISLNATVEHTTAVSQKLTNNLEIGKSKVLLELTRSSPAHLSRRQAEKGGKKTRKPNKLKKENRKLNVLKKKADVVLPYNLRKRTFKGLYI